MSKAKRPSKAALQRRRLCNRVCECLAEGLSLRQAIKAVPGISKTAFLRAVLHDTPPGLADQYARARDLGDMQIEHELLEIADDGTNDTYVDEKGNERVDYDNIHRSRLRVDTRKWLLAKRKPRQYGDRVDLTSGDKPLEPSTVFMLFGKEVRL